MMIHAFFTFSPFSRLYARFNFLRSATKFTDFEHKKFEANIKLCTCTKNFSKFE